MRFCDLSVRCPRRTRCNTYLATLFQQYLVVLAERDAEDDGGHILKTVYPFLPLASLAADIEHTIMR